MIEILVNTGYNQPNRSLDLNGDEAFSINYEIANVQDISNSGGAYTKSLTLPNTGKNRTIFGYVTDMAVDLGHNYFTNHSNSFNPNKKIKCWVLENTIVVLQGYIQLTDFDINTVDNNDQLNVTIYADNASFYIAMGDSLLTDLDFSEYSFTYSTTAITNTWNNNNDAFRKGVYFPLIDYGHGWTLDDLNNPLLYNLGLKDFLPAVFVKTIWDKVFATYSYSVQSNFTGGNKGNGMIPDSRFGNLVIPFSQQNFQVGTTFSQDKIFHVGLSQSTLGQFSTYSIGAYQAKGCQAWPSFSPGTASGVPATIINAIGNGVFGVGIVDSVRNLWYDGYLMSPFQQDFYRNQSFNNTDHPWSYDEVVIPFSLTASPMFETYNSVGDPTYNTGPAIPDFNYQNNSDDIFKQRFVLNTDIVTNWSNQWIIDVNLPRDKTSSGESYAYAIKVAFYREYDMSIGATTSSDWMGGTGTQIPADLGGIGGALTLCEDITGTTDSLSHWICDLNFNSNVFTKDGTIIVPTGDNRYLGKYCTNEIGDQCVTGGTASDQFEYKSGDCLAWYYNDAYGQIDSRMTGLWCSGYKPDAFDYHYEATWQPGYGDWYQQLQCQTIYLDNDATDPLYGAAGSVMVNGNIPIQPNEKVRCVVFFYGKYKGQQEVGTFTSYKPPTSGTILTSTIFANDLQYPYGNYQHPATQADINGVKTGNPLTVFFNDVSNDYIAGMRVNFNDCIPKNVKQRDFIQDIVHLHNLYIEPVNGETKTLMIEPREDYYKLSSTSLDWSTKLDLTQPVNVQVLAETQNVRTTFSYKSDNDWYNKLYTQNTNEIYGQFINQIDNDYLTGETKIDSMFSPTPLSSLFSVFSDGNSLTELGAFILPVFVSGANITPSSNVGPNGSTQVNYRILIKKWLSNQNADTINVFGSATHNYPYVGPYDDPYTPAYTVNWGQTLGEFIPTATDEFSANLVNTYWAGLLTEMTDMDSRIITCYMFLTPKDINTFQFYNLVFVTIDGVDGFYKVNSIEDYTPGKNSTCKVTLLRSNTFLTPNTYTGSIG